jgi:SulP family sulfate permease
VAAAVVRSVAAYDAGASTRLAALVKSLLLLVLLFFAPLLSNVPFVALASILLVVGFRLIQWRSLFAMWRMARSEGLIFLGTAAGILLTDFVLGVALGVIAALARFAQQQRAVLQTRATRDLVTESEPRELTNSLRLLRLEGPLFFAAQRSIEDAIGALDQARHVVVDLSAVSTVDVSGATALAHALRRLASTGVRVRVTTFGAAMDPLLDWALAQHAPGDVLPLEQRAEQALRSLAKRAAVSAALLPDRRASA